MTPRPINATLAMIPPSLCCLRPQCLYSRTMAPTKQQILDSLAKIPGPDGTPLSASGKLSDVMVSDGKVFFSITVDAAAGQAWASVRDRAQAAVQAVPGVQSAMVALTAERNATARPAGPQG